MYSNMIANLEGFDAQTKKIILEASKYYSCGRQLDAYEEHEKHSAKIAGEDLQGQLTDNEIRLIQATIEAEQIKIEIYRDRYGQTRYKEASQAVEEKTEELMRKYQIDSIEVQKVMKMAECIRDAVALDTTQFVERAEYNSPSELKFRF